MDSCRTAKRLGARLYAADIRSMARENATSLGAKIVELGVPDEVLATKGAVSPECAAAMAEGARRLLKTDLAVALTGIAGPGGGTAEKPVGLVWFGLASPSSTATEMKIFPGEREAVRTAAIEYALCLLLNEALAS